MANNFDVFFQRVLADEGVTYEDVRGDNGGPTKCGLTIADVARANGVKCPPRGGKGWDDLVQKVHELNPGTARDLYKRFYWDAVRADDLPSGLDYALVDYAVNSGVGRAVPALGSLVGVKGSTVTDAMIAAARNYGSLASLVEHLQDNRKAFLERIAQADHNRKFREGWLARESRVRRVALDLAAKETPQRPISKLPRPGDAISTAPAPTPGRMIVESRTTRYQVASIALGLVAKFKAAAVTIGAGLAWLIEQLPDITKEAGDNVSAVKDFAAMVGAGEAVAAAATVLSIGFAGVVIVRHLADRKELKTLKGE